MSGAGSPRKAVKVYTYSEARQNLAAILEQAKRDGAVRIRRRDGQTFSISPEQTRKSPLDVKGVDLGLTRDEIIELIHEGRRDN